MPSHPPVIKLLEQKGGHRIHIGAIPTFSNGKSKTCLIHPTPQLFYFPQVLLQISLSPERAFQKPVLPHPPNLRTSMQSLLTWPQWVLFRWKTHWNRVPMSREHKKPSTPFHCFCPWNVTFPEYLHCIVWFWLLPACAEWKLTHSDYIFGNSNLNKWAKWKTCQVSGVPPETKTGTQMPKGRYVYFCFVFSCHLFKDMQLVHLRHNCRLWDSCWGCPAKVTLFIWFTEKQREKGRGRKRRGDYEWENGRSCAGHLVRNWWLRSDWWNAWHCHTYVYHWHSGQKSPKTLP